MAEELGVADRCTFVGDVAHDEVLRRMRNAYVTVVPSISESFGWVNIESMAVGTPVVASNVDGPAEILRDGEDGFLFPQGDPAALAEKLKLLLLDPALREAMGAKARVKFLARFELRGVVKAEADWLEQLVSAL
jgi:D-inositol-3-phosphate glycosyltransferase